jgi:hypothetical protein
MRKTEEEKNIDIEFNKLLNVQSQLKLNIIRLYSDKYLMEDEIKEIETQNEELLRTYKTLAKYFLERKIMKQVSIKLRELKAMGVK